MGMCKTILIKVLKENDMTIVDGQIYRSLIDQRTFPSQLNDYSEGSVISNFTYK